jgi:copper oxidase (laccase) domain-containing protein
MILRATSTFPLEGKIKGSPVIYLFGRPGDMSEPDTFKSLKSAAKRYGIGRLYAPNPSKSNARIAEKEEFGAPMPAKEHIPFYSGVEADGVVLNKPGDGAVILSADCPTITVWNSIENPKNRKVIVAHAGRDSLLDKSIFMGHSKSRMQYSSVVDAVLAQFEPAVHCRLSVHSSLGIAARKFLHPANDKEYAKQNSAMIEYVCDRFGAECFNGNSDDGALNLHALIKRQFEIAGVNPRNIHRDLHDTYSGKRRMTGKQLQWHSHRRAGQNGYTGRNAVLVLHSEPGK